MAKKRQIKKENMRLREQAEKNNKIIADLKNQLKMKESEKIKGPAAPSEDFVKNVLDKLSYLESTISRIQKDVIESDPKDLHAKEEYVKLIDQVKRLFKSFVNDIKSSFTNKVDGVKNEINSLITNKVQSINDKFKALSDSIDAKFPDPAREAVEKQEPAKEAAQAVEKQEPAKEAAQAVEKQEPAKEAAQAVEKQEPAKEAAQAVEKQEPAKEAAQAVEKQEPAKEAAQAVEKQEPAKEAAQAVEKQEPAKEAAQAVEKQEPAKEAAQAVVVPQVSELIAENNTLKSENNGLKSENASLKTFVSAIRKFYPDQVNDTQNKINKMFEAQHAKPKDQDIQKPTQKVTTIKSESISL